MTDGRMVLLKNQNIFVKELIHIPKNIHQTLIYHSLSISLILAKVQDIMRDIVVYLQISKSKNKALQFELEYLQEQKKRLSEKVMEIESMQRSI